MDGFMGHYSFAEYGDKRYSQYILWFFQAELSDERTTNRERTE